ncbi:hypothetical protein UlMin_018315 [Ulmus minor]
MGGTMHLGSRRTYFQRHVFVQVLKNEGPKSLYLGLTPALTRSVLYGGLRLGLYEPSKYACDWAFGSINIFFKIASGGFAGSFATALTNSIEVLKGLGPAMAKAAALIASQLTTYDESKQILVRWTRLEEGFNLHLLYNSTMKNCCIGMLKMLTMRPDGSSTIPVLSEGNCTLFKQGSEKIIKIGGSIISYRVGSQKFIL